MRHSGCIDWCAFVLDNGTLRWYAARSMEFRDHRLVSTLLLPPQLLHPLNQSDLVSLELGGGQALTDVAHSTAVLFEKPRNLPSSTFHQDSLAVQFFLTLTC